MYRMPNESIRSHGQVNGYVVPAAADAVCPACRWRVTFRFDSWQWDAEVKGKPKASSCPGCRETTNFIWLDAPTQGDSTGRLYMDAENYGRVPLSDLWLVPEDQFSPGLRRAYESALNVLNIGEAEAAASAIRRVLEGVVKQLVPSDNPSEPLARRLNRLASEVNLNTPLTELTAAVKDGGISRYISTRTASRRP